MTKVIVGFTGTFQGMSNEQYQALYRLVKRLQPVEVHHGDCVGADAQFHDIVRKVSPKTRIVIHPPEDDTLRARKVGDEIRPAKSYLDRNHDIVDEVDWLLAAPYTRREMLRSGTWATVRYARKRGIKVSFAYPETEGVKDDEQRRTQD